MDLPGPWWGAPLFTLVGALGGVVLTMLGAIWLDHRKDQRYAASRATEHQRETNFRWVRDKRELYSHHLNACHDLRDVAVWPRDRNLPPQPAGPLADKIAQHAVEVELITGQSMTEFSRKTVMAARALAASIQEIRNNSKPGYQGRIEEEYRNTYVCALDNFTTVVAEFTDAAKRDLDIAEPGKQLD